MALYKFRIIITV